MAFQPTPQQKIAIEAKGTILVSAAAGSGKTAVLVERVMGLLMDPAAPVDADRLLIVTFTNAAAAEMRTRIERRLAEELERTPDSPRLIRQQLLLSRASICTIDSFCIDLVREHFQLLNIQPDFKIADPASLAPVEEKAVTRVLEKCYGEDDPAFRLLLETLGADYGDGPLVDAIQKLYASSQCMPFPEDWLRQAADLYRPGQGLTDTPWAALLFDRAEREVRGALEEVNRAMERIRGADKIGDAYGPSLAAGKEQLEGLLGRILSRDWDGVYDGCRQLDFPPFKALRNFPDEDLKNQVKAARERAQKQVERLSGRFFAPAHQQEALLETAGVCVRKLCGLTAAYGEEKRRLLEMKGALGFDDIEHLALRLLVKREDGELRPTPAAEEICRRYDQVLVDEYQDTNNLQDALFYALSDNGRNLFMVGDVKQSIYRFRHANPDNFMSRKNSYALLESPDQELEGPSKIILGSNFRSRAGVCQYVNFLFGLLMSEQAGEMDYTEEERLLPASVFPERSEADTELHLLSCRQEGEKREQAEARYIARYIRDYMDGTPRLRDEQNPDGLRPARYGDFTILLRSPSSRAQIYVNELRKQGIPVWADLGGFLQTTEIMTFLSLLQIIDNPRREVPLLAVLLSPLFGFTPDEVAKIRIQQPKGNLYAALVRAKATDQKCADFYAALREYRQLAVTLSVEALIRRLYEATGYMAMVLALPDGRRRRANLQLLLDYARAFDAQEGGLSGFLRFMDKLGESENLKSASAAGQGGEAVKIMSIHASKGLQFPVCILAAGSSRFNKADSTDSLLVHEKGGIGFKMYDEGRRVRYTTAAREAIALLTDEAAMAEELRLLYVALTRAEEKLVLLVCEDNLERSLTRLAGMLGQNAGQDGKKVDPAAVLAARGYADWMLAAGLLHPDGAALRTLAGVSLTPAAAEGRMAVYLEDETELEKKLEKEQPAETAGTPSRLEAEPTDGDGQFSFFGGTAADPAETERWELAAALKGRFGYVYPYERLNELAAKTGVAKLVEKQADKAYACTRRPAFLAKSGLTPTERGVAVHAFMQFADYDAAARAPEAELERLADRGFLTVQQADAIDPAVLRRFFGSPLYKRMAGAARLDREVRFLTELPARRIDPTLPEGLADEMVVVQGVADCVFEEPDGLVILDFKTDRGKSMEQLLEDYGDQLRVYAEALRDTYGKPVKECVLYAFSQGTSISFPPGLRPA